MEQKQNYQLEGPILQTTSQSEKTISTKYIFKKKWNIIAKHQTPRTPTKIGMKKKKKL
jgi:hypothetical protein